MTHLYTRGTEYGLLSLQVMLSKPDACWRVTDVCEHAGVPEQFTRKVINALVRAKILTSTRGPQGGIQFARPPHEISLLEVVEAVESKARFDLCILGFATCDAKEPCALHHLWAPIKASALGMLEKRTVDDLAGVPMSRKHKN